MKLADIKNKVRENQLSGRFQYEGLNDDEIGQHSGWLMFGDNDEAFPGQDEWSRTVD